jgi:hypothetical protein
MAPSFDPVKIYNQPQLLHRYLSRLSKKELRCLNKQSLLPGVKLLVLQTKRAYKLDIEAAVHFLTSNLETYFKWLPRRKEVTIHKPIKECFFLLELEAYGYKRLPSKNFKRSLRKLGLYEQGNYIITNRTIDGDIWIYPMEMGNKMLELKQGMIYIWTAMGLIGIPGISKIHINGD